jgi:hypothetical protein
LWLRAIGWRSSLWSITGLWSSGLGSIAWLWSCAVVRRRGLRGGPRLPALVVRRLMRIEAWGSWSWRLRRALNWWRVTCRRRSLRKIRHCLRCGLEISGGAWTDRTVYDQPQPHRIRDLAWWRSANIFRAVAEHASMKMRCRTFRKQSVVGESCYYELLYGGPRAPHPSWTYCLHSRTNQNATQRIETAV